MRDNHHVGNSCGNNVPCLNYFMRYKRVPLHHWGSGFLSKKCSQIALNFTKTIVRASCSRFCLARNKDRVGRLNPRQFQPSPSPPTSFPLPRHREFWKSGWAEIRPGNPLFLPPSSLPSPPFAGVMFVEASWSAYSCHHVLVYKYCILHRLLFLQIVYTILIIFFSFVEIYSASKKWRFVF